MMFNVRSVLHIMQFQKQVNDGTFDECAYVKDDDDLCA